MRGVSRPPFLGYSPLRQGSPLIPRKIGSPVKIAALDLSDHSSLKGAADDPYGRIGVCTEQVHIIIATTLKLKPKMYCSNKLLINDVESTMADHDVPADLH